MKGILVYRLKSNSDMWTSKQLLLCVMFVRLCKSKKNHLADALTIEHQCVAFFFFFNRPLFSCTATLDHSHFHPLCLHSGPSEIKLLRFHVYEVLVWYLQADPPVMVTLFPHQTCADTFVPGEFWLLLMTPLVYQGVGRVRVRARWWGVLMMCQLTWQKSH